MNIVFSAIIVACLVIIAICCIVFPILFLVSFHRFRKEMVCTWEKQKNILEVNKTEEDKIEI